MSLFDWTKEELVHALAEKRGQCEGLKRTVNLLKDQLESMGCNIDAHYTHMGEIIGSARLEDEEYDLLSKKRIEDDS